jgi:hypothetical protein
MPAGFAFHAAQNVRVVQVKLVDAVSVAVLWPHSAENDTILEVGVVAMDKHGTGLKEVQIALEWS